jgi:hypothetical protein
MGQRIQVKAIRKEKPQVGLYVLALIELARQLQAAEEQETTPPVIGGRAREASDERI